MMKKKKKKKRKKEGKKEKEKEEANKQKKKQRFRFLTPRGTTCQSDISTLCHVQQTNVFTIFGVLSQRSKELLRRKAGLLGILKAQKKEKSLRIFFCEKKKKGKREKNGKKFLPFQKGAFLAFQTRGQCVRSPPNTNKKMKNAPKDPKIAKMKKKTFPFSKTLSLLFILLFSTF